MARKFDYTISVWQKSEQIASGESAKKLLCMFFEVKNLEAALNLCRGALQVAITQVSPDCFCTISDGNKKIGTYFYNTFAAEYQFKSAISFSDITRSPGYRLNKTYY